MKSALAASLLALTAVLASPAKADVIYSFVQTSPTWTSPGSPYASTDTIGVVTSMTLVVSDQAAQNGFSVRASSGGGASVAQTDGVLGLFVSVFNGPFPNGSLRYTLADFTYEDPRQPSSSPVFRLSLAAAAGGMLNGTVAFNNTSDEARLAFDGTSVVQGMFNSDGAGACWYGGCTFSGVQQRLATTVPEPASLAVFGVALGGLALARRRRA